MTFDLLWTMGLDNRDFRAKLEESRSQVDLVAGRVGESISASTQGFRKAIGSITQIVGMVGAVTGFVGIAYGAVKALESWADASERARQAADAERASRDKIYSTLRAQMELTSARQSGDPYAERRLEINRRFEEMIAQLGNFQGPWSASGATPTEEDRRKLATYLELLAMWRREIRGLDEEQRGRDAYAFASDTEIQQLRLAGELVKAQNLEEADLHEQRLRRAREIAGTDAERLQRLYALETRRHEEKLKQIEREAAEREKAERQRLEREAEAARRNAVDNDEAAARSRIEELRLRGMDKEADAAERRLQHEKNLEDIRRRDGLTTEERQRMIEQENTNAQLREAAAGRQRVEAARERNRTLEGGGFIQIGQLVRQAFSAGPPKNPQIDKTNGTLDQIRKLLDEMKRAMSGGDRVYGTFGP